jgi:hypothetical protein
MINKLNELLVYLLVLHAYIKEMHRSRSKIPSKKSRPYIYDVKIYRFTRSSVYIYIYIHMCVCVCVCVYTTLIG